MVEASPGALPTPLDVPGPLTGAWALTGGRPRGEAVGDAGSDVADLWSAQRDTSAKSGDVVSILLAPRFEEPEASGDVGHTVQVEPVQPSPHPAT